MYRVEDYPEIQNNFFLKSRAIGASRKLCGKIGIITCFMKRRGSDFSDRVKNQYYAELNAAIDWLKSEALRYGRKLEIDHFHYDIDVPANAEPKDDYKLIKSFLNSESMDSTQSYLENKMGYDEMPFILVYDENARSFARSQWADSRYKVEECSTVFKSGGKYHQSTIVHELLHQFGAHDFYFPKEIKRLAERYFGDSVMGIGNMKVDDFTAYLIGWKDTISANTYWYLKDTAYMTEELYSKAISDAWEE
jgi:hypothetical protein